MTKFNNQKKFNKKFNLAYTSYKNVKATAERKPPKTWGYSLENND